MSNLGAVPEPDLDNYWTQIEMPDGSYLAALMSDYATTSTSWNNLLRSSNGPTTYNPFPGERQVYGCFIGFVPDTLLPYVGTRTMWGAGRGYNSGQTSTCGPSLYLFDPDDPSDAVSIFRHPNFDYNADPSKVQTRPATYTGALWNGLTPNYWQADRVESVMLHRKYGYVIVAAFGEGPLDYGSQNYNLAPTTALYMGQITLANIIAAIQSPPGVGELHVPSWTAWPHAWPRGMWITNDGRIHTCNPNAWNAGGPENYPSISVYELPA